MLLDNQSGLDEVFELYIYMLLDCLLLEIIDDDEHFLMALCSPCSNTFHTPLVPLELRALEYILSVIPQLYSTSHLQFFFHRALAFYYPGIFSLLLFPVFLPPIPCFFSSFSFYFYFFVQRTLWHLYSLSVHNNPTSVNPV